MQTDYQKMSKTDLISTLKRLGKDYESLRERFISVSNKADEEREEAETTADEHKTLVGVNSALQARVDKLEHVIVHHARLLRIVKATVNGVVFPGEDVSFHPVKPLL